MIPISAIGLLCAFAAAMPGIGTDPKCADISKKSSSTLRTFTYAPASAPGSTIPTNTPLQFNGSYSGQGDIPGPVGWWEKDAGGDGLVDLKSFVQYNADSGVVFWVKRTRFELYLSTVLGTATGKKSYAVKLGQPLSETPPGLAGNWTVSKIPKQSSTSTQEYGFGWEGDYKSWFACEKNPGFYGLYFGDKLDGCSDQFVLKTVYDQPPE